MKKMYKIKRSLMDNNLTNDRKYICKRQICCEKNNKKFIILR